MNNNYTPHSAISSQPIFPQPYLRLLKCDGTKSFGKRVREQDGLNEWKQQHGRRVSEHRDHTIFHPKPITNTTTHRPTVAATRAERSPAVYRAAETHFCPFCGCFGLSPSRKKCDCELLANQMQARFCFIQK